MTLTRASLYAAVAAVSLCSGGLLMAAQSAAPAAPTPPGRQLGPPPGAGNLLEDDVNNAPPAPVEEKPIIPVAPPQARPSRAPDTSTDRTKMLLGEVEILDIPLDQIPNYREIMRGIVTDLATYAHARDQKFIVTTRGGFDMLAWSQREYELAEVKRDPLAKEPADTILRVGTPLRLYIQGLNGLVLNGQFCAPLRVPHDDLDDMKKLGLKFLSIDHCKDAAGAQSALQASIKTSVVSHTDIDRADIFTAVPKAKPQPENPRNVQVLGDARNMLVMLDSANYASREEWLAALQSTNYDVLITDAFYKGKQNLTKAEVHGLKFKQMGARRLVLARMDVGFAEDQRYYWKREWRIGEPSWIQAFVPDHPGQYVVEFWNPAWKAIVGKYFTGLMDLGFDGVVFDGVEAYRRWEFRTPLDPGQADAARATKPRASTAAAPAQPK